MLTNLHTTHDQPVTMMIGGAEIHATLTVPADAAALVIFAHASGNSRANAHNLELSRILAQASLATLLCDLLTAEEETLSAITGEFRFDVTLMAKRLTGVVDWCAEQPDLRGLPIGFFGAGTGAAAAMVAAAGRKRAVKAIVIRGGRLDLAWSYLPLVEAPTLLIAGEDDIPIQAAYSVSMPRLQSPTKELLIIPRAGHLFQEPGARAQLGKHAAKWFNVHLGSTGVLPEGWTTEVC